MTTSSVAAGFVEGKNLKVDGKRGSSAEDLSDLNLPEEELSSLVGGGRYWDQSSIRLADIELYACKPNVALYAVLSLHQHPGCWCRSQQILVPNQFLVSVSHVLCTHSVWRCSGKAMHAFVVAPDCGLVHGAELRF